LCRERDTDERVDLIKLRQKLLEAKVRNDTSDRVLDALSRGIHTASERIENAANKSSDDDGGYYDAVLDDETDAIENLLGSAFIVCQTYLTGVVSAVIKLDDLCRGTVGGLPLASGRARERRQKILSCMGPMVGTKSNRRSVAEVVEAFANYFKHRDEWKTMNWNKLDERSRRTARVVASAGATSGSTGNLRTGSAKLGNPRFTDLDVFAAKLHEWGANISKQVAKEVAILGSVPKKNSG
jgi:hypothetical protein